MAENVKECCKPGAPSDYQPKGTVKAINGLETYVAGSSDAKQAVIIVTDVFGYEHAYARKIADRIASNGFLALLPDLMDNDPLKADSDFMKAWEAWYPNHKPEDAVPKLDAVFSYLAEQGITATGIMGFCWGGKIAALAAGTGKVGAAVALHGSFITTKIAGAAKVPTYYIVPEGDRIFPAELVAAVRETIASNPKLADCCKVEVVQGVTHGFGCRPDPKDENAVAASHKYIGETIEWFKKHLN